MSLLDDLKAQALRAATRVAADPRAQAILEDPRLYEVAGKAAEAGARAQAAWRQMRDEVKLVTGALDARDDLASLKRALDRAREDR